MFKDFYTLFFFLKRISIATVRIEAQAPIVHGRIGVSSPVLTTLAMVSVFPSVDAVAVAACSVFLSAAPAMLTVLSVFWVVSLCLFVSDCFVVSVCFCFSVCFVVSLCAVVSLWTVSLCVSVLFELVSTVVSDCFSVLDSVYF